MGVTQEMGNPFDDAGPEETNLNFMMAPPMPAEVDPLKNPLRRVTW